MNCGIYCYKDSLKNDSIVYIGKDSNISQNKRHKDHMKPSNYDAQQINRVLQNNPDRYKYEVLKSWEFDDYSPNLANALEIIYIKRYNPRFNFTIGGEGMIGFKHSDESKKRMSESHKSLYAHKKHHMCGKHHSEETKRKMSLSHKGDKNYSWKNYPRIIKNGSCDGKQIYAIVHNGKVVKQSIYLEKLELRLRELQN